MERVSALEAPQPRLEKRLAELDGKVKWGSGVGCCGCFFPLMNLIPLFYFEIHGLFLNENP